MIVLTTEAVSLTESHYINSTVNEQGMMDVSTCVNSDAPDNLNISILFERVLPSLVTGQLFGGIPPYIFYISNLKSSGFEKGKINDS